MARFTYIFGLIFPTLSFVLFPSLTRADGSTDPTVIISSPANNQEVSGYVDIQVQVSNFAETPTVEFLVDGTNTQTIGEPPFNFSWDTRRVVNGQHILSVRATDSAGNLAETSIQVQLNNIDPINPAVSILLPPANAFIRGITDIIGSAIDNNGVAKVEFYIDSNLRDAVLTSPYIYRWDSSGETNGSHVLRLKAFDFANNFTPSEERTVAVDNEPPTVRFNNLRDNDSVTGTVNVIVLASDNVGLSKVEFYVRSDLKETKTAAPFHFSWSTVLESTGSCVISAWAYDTAGNSNSTSIQVTVRDSSAPTIQIISPEKRASPPYTVVAGTVQVIASATDQQTGISRVEFRVGSELRSSSTIAPYTFNWDTTIKDAANNTLSVTAKAYDGAGNSKTDQIFLTVMDITPPKIQVISPVPGSQVSGNVLISANITDTWGVRSVQFRVGPIFITPTASGSTYSYTGPTIGLADGEYTIVFEAYDLGNRYSRSEVTVYLRNSDFTPPQVNISSPQPHDVISGLVTVSGTASDNVGISSVAFYVDGIWKAWTTSRLFNFLLDTRSMTNGPHTIMVKAFDYPRNDGSSVIEVEVRNRDETPPQVSFIFPEPNQIVFGVVPIAASASDNVGVERVEFYVDENLVFTKNDLPYSYSWISNSVPNGPHTLGIRGYDNEGNSDFHSLPVIVDNSEISHGRVIPHPADKAFLCCSDPLRIFATFEGAQPNPDALSPVLLQESLKVYATQNGFRFRIPGTVNLSDGQLSFQGNFPENTLLDWSVNTVDQDGKLLLGSFQCTYPMSSSKGGTVSSDDEIISIQIPPSAFSEDVFIAIKPEMGLKNTNDCPSCRIIAGPYSIVAVNRIGELRQELARTAKLNFKEPPADNPIDDQNRLVQIQERDESTDRWNPMVANVPMVHGPYLVNELGTYRLVAILNLNSGLSNFMNYPNPFSPKEGGTKFSYLLSEDSEVTMVVYNLLGDLVKKIEIAPGDLGGRAGDNTYPWDGRNGKGEFIASGGYIVHVFSKGIEGNKTKIKRKILVVR